MKSQIELPGVERKTIKSIDDAAEELRKVRKKRIGLTEEEGKLAANLKGLLEKHGIQSYVYESEEEDDDGNLISFDVLLDGEPKVKVRKHKDAKPSTNAEDKGPVED